MKVLQLNHVAIHVADLAASRRFYGGVLGLREIARPAFDFDGAWFAIGDARAGEPSQELHLIVRPPREGPYTVPRERHFALLVGDVASASDRLRSEGVAFQPAVRRPDGAMQVFLRDPDGHVIELCQLAG